MTTTTETQQFNLTGYGDGVTTGQASVVSYDTAGRWVRALQGLGIAWGVAIATAFIPVAHFVLVPGFGLFGLYIFFKRLGIKSIANEVTGTCPDCSLEQSFNIDGAWRLPQSLTCNGCRRTLKATISAT